MKNIINIKEILWDLFSCGLPADYDLDVLRKIFLLNLLLIVGAFFVALLGAVAFIQDNYLLGTVDYLAFILVIYLFFFLRRTKRFDSAAIAGIIYMGTFYFFLFASGGVDNTAFVWSYTFPIIALFLLGKRAGTIATFIFLFLLCIVFVLGSEISFIASYRVNLIIRYIPSYISIYLITFVMEKSRELSQERLSTLNIDLENANDELKNANQLKEDLLHITAHDLRNPLFNIKGGTDLLVNKQVSADEKNELLKSIANSTNSMIILIDNLLETAKIENSNLTLKMEKVGISSLLKKVIAGMELRFKGKHQTIQCDCPEDIDITADKNKLSQVFQNLISNSLKYSHAESLIIITVKRERESIIIEFKDNGIGFTDEDKKLLFGKFQKLSGRPTDGEPSTGLGLFIVKNHIEAHNGSVWLESEKNKGSSFFIRLPIAP